MREHLGSHVAEYAIEGLLLGAFLVSASVVTIALEHPDSPLHAAIASAHLRRALTGVAMGLTAVALVYSRAGRRSGAHMNPAVTLTFFRLGKLDARDAAGYVAGQVAGAVSAMALVAALAPSFIAHPAVNHVRTAPGPSGAAAALAAEAAISFGMMLMVLAVSGSRWRGATGICAGVLIAVYITVEAPVSGMSMNPARSFGPAAIAGSYDAFWVYLLAPAAGMLGAAECYVRRNGLEAIACAKLHHDTRSRCIFRCRWAPRTAAPQAPVSSTATAWPAHVE
jgi:aquaporin Z